MPRFVSGFFTREDVARPREHASVRLLSAERKALGRAQVVDLSTTELRLKGIDGLALGSRLHVAITIPERFIEFEVPGEVSRQSGEELIIRLGHLSARQAYGIALVVELRRRAQPGQRASVAAKRGLRF